MNNKERDRTDKKEQEDLGIKIGTKTEAKWTKIEKKAEENIENMETEIEINKKIILLAKEKIKKEKEKPSGVG